MAYVEVDVDLDRFDTLDIIDELNMRRKMGDRQAMEWASGAIVTEDDIKEIVEKIYMCRVFKVDDTEYVRELVDRVLGRIL
jgi:hypothetical protein